MKRVTSSDGVGLAVTEAGAGAQTVVCVHGYPDSSTVWDGVVAELRDRYHVVTYDVRGAGRSDVPRHRSAYRLGQLVEDLRAVIDTVSPDRPVHLLAHDWGSIQCWHAVTSERLPGRVASFTSISGPDLDHASAWLRSALRPGGAKLRHVARQLAESAYILLFITPMLPELLWRARMLDRLLAGIARIGRGPTRSGHTRSGHNPAGPAPRQTLADKLNGLQLYRANMPPRPGRPRPRPTDVPVQVIVPARDMFVSPALQADAPRAWASDLRVRTVAGGHWVISARPRVIARLTSELIDSVTPCHARHVTPIS